MEATVIVVAQDADLGRLFDYVLRMDGYAVAVYHDWDAARGVCAAAAPDLLIYDCGRATDAGLSWATELRATQGLAHVPILLVCGDLPSPTVTSQLRRAGVPLLVKPFDIFELSAHVAAALSLRERSAGAL